MDSKRMILAVAIVFVALGVAGFLIHGIWLGPTYQAMRDDGFSFRVPDALQHRLWLIWVGDRSMPSSSSGCTTAVVRTSLGLGRASVTAC